MEWQLLLLVFTLELCVYVICRTVVFVKIIRGLLQGESEEEFDDDSFLFSPFWCEGE